ncbi:MAG: phosphoribosylamine--glycine ligase, partial [Limisphaerales bacterium]
MKLLVIGGGGREHALVWKLAQSPHASRIWCAPGNAGIAAERLAATGTAVECVPLAADDLGALVAFAAEERPNLTIVGPDSPLALGIVDLFQRHGLRIWGPNQRAAQFESSKVFSQNFMGVHGVPTARSGTFHDPHAAKAFARSLDGRCAVKADGLALGKGVILTGSRAEADRAVDDLMVNRLFGRSGERVVIQELLEGTEISLHALSDGCCVKLFPTAQDHKRAGDGDTGPNTGGMGTYSPAPFLTEDELLATARQILMPWQRGCHAEGIDFRGIIYPGVMLTADGPKVLEFNARFGDPEAQTYLTRLESDLVELLDACLTGTLDKLELRWAPHASVCVVMASAGYPGAYEKGAPIDGLEEAATLPGVKVFHAGTALNDDRCVTAGGRVLGVTAWAPTL